MKTPFLILLLNLSSLQSDTHKDISYAIAIHQNTSKEIPLKKTTSEQKSNSGDIVIMRSQKRHTVRAFLYNDIIAIQSNTSIPYATVNIYDDNSNILLLSTEYYSINSCCINIPDMDNSNYRIEIIYNDLCMIGHFCN